MSKRTGKKVYNWVRGRRVRISAASKFNARNVANVLDRAADLFDELGWVKGAECSGSGKVCAIGAIKVALGGETTHGYTVRLNDAKRDLYQGAWMAASLLTRQEDIVEYNDSKRTKQVDVQAKLRQAAEEVRSGKIQLTVGTDTYGAPRVVATRGKKTI